MRFLFPGTHSLATPIAPSRNSLTSQEAQTSEQSVITPPPDLILFDSLSSYQSPSHFMVAFIIHCSASLPLAQLQTATRWAFWSRSETLDADRHHGSTHRGQSVPASSQVPSPGSDSPTVAVLTLALHLSSTAENELIKAVYSLESRWTPNNRRLRQSRDGSLKIGKAASLNSWNLNQIWICSTVCSLAGLKQPTLGPLSFENYDLPQWLLQTVCHCSSSTAQHCTSKSVSPHLLCLQAEAAVRWLLPSHRSTTAMNGQQQRSQHPVNFPTTLTSPKGMKKASLSKAQQPDHWEMLAPKHSS